MSRLLFRRPISPVGLILLLAVCTFCLRPLVAMDEKKPNPADSVAARESGLPPAGGAGADAASKVSPSADWTSRASEEIQRSEYFFSSQADGSFAAPNRAHDLRVRLDASALRVSSRTKGANSQDGGWELQLALSAFGREGNLSPVGAAHPNVANERAEFQRGPLSEWYLNRDSGLEQGFTLQSPPRTGPGQAPLILEMALKGSLSAFPTEDGQAVLFKTSAGVDVLRYAGLVVTDARGSKIDASLAVLPGRLQFRIDDRSAVYPLNIDPLLTSPSWTFESDQKNAEFGISVATAGDVNGDGFSDVIVGAHLFDNGQTDEGRAFVFLGSASGLATTAAWTAESDQTGSGQNGTRAPEFGLSVASAGDVNGDGYSDVIVGAPYWDGSNQDEGRAFVWYGSSTGLGANGTPTNADWAAGPPCCDQTLAYFGYSVATAGDVNGDGYSDVIVGAYQEDDGIQASEGRARVYHGSASGLSTSPAWTAEGNETGGALPAVFGASVASAGDVNGDGYDDVIVGAPYYDNGQNEEGRAFVFLGSSSGLSTSYSWSAESNQLNGYFGNSVASAGDINGDGYGDVIVGSPGYDNGSTDEGRAYVFLGSSTGLATSAAWTAESDQASVFFGIVGTAGDVNGDGFSDVIVGGPSYDNGQTDEGRAFVWYGSASGLGSNGTPGNADWSAESNLASAFFGRSVATAGDVNGDGLSDVLVGAHQWESTGGQANEGRAYLFLGSTTGLATSAGWTAEGDQDNALFRVVATAGDVNGDGFSDVIVGAPGYDNGQTDEGRAFVYLGSSTGLATTAAWTAESDQASAGFGISVGTAGDVNGDGYSDVIVGAWQFDNGQNNEGRAFVYLGSSTGLASSTAWTAESDQDGANFGYSVGTAGDVNADGFSDVIVGAYNYSNGQSQEGRAFVYLGSSTGLASTAGWTAESDQVQALFGISVGTAGDVNRDGYSDVIVGANQYDNGSSDEGRAFVYHGSSTGLASSAAWTAESNQNGAQFGLSVGTAGDVNGDGYSDVIIGAPTYSISTFTGRAYVYHGSSTGLTSTPWTADATQNNAWFGFAVGTAGDVNGDGYSDVIIGAHQFSNGEAGEGRAYVYHGSSTGLGSTAPWVTESNQVGAGYGAWVGTAGDVNGDGYGDVLVAAAAFDNGQTDEGRAYLYFGNGGPALTRVPNQARSDDSALIALLGKSDSSSAFKLHALGRTAAGRGKVRLVWEVKALGTAFNGTGLGQSSLVDTGSPGSSGSAASFSESVSGLTSGTAYKWRVRTLSGNVFFPRTPWISLPYNGRSETDLRTAP